MKTTSLLLVIISSSTSFAETQISCSGHEATVTRSKETSRYKPEQALKLAVKACFDKQESVKVAVQKAVKNSINNTGAYECSAKNSQVIPLTDWTSGRSSYEGEMGSEGTFIVRIPIFCQDAGTGLYSGVDSNVLYTVQSSESTRIDLKTSKVNQVFSFTNSQPLDYKF